MVTLRYHILLLFHGRQSWSSSEIAQTLGVDHDQIKDEIRHLTRLGWFKTSEYNGDIAVGLIDGGKAELTDLLGRLQSGPSKQNGE